MIAFLMKASSVLAALVQLVKAAVAIIAECKKAYTEVVQSLSDNGKPKIVTLQAETVNTENAKLEEVANTKSEAKKVFDIKSYPEVDLSIFEGRNFSWAPSLDAAYD